MRSVFEFEFIHLQNRFERKTTFKKTTKYWASEEDNFQCFSFNASLTNRQRFLLARKIVDTYFNSHRCLIDCLRPSSWNERNKFFFFFNRDMMFKSN